MQYDPFFDHWLLLDWCAYNFETRILTKTEADVVFEMMYHGCTFVKFCSLVPKSGTTRSPVLYCVSFIKHLLGVKSLAITPYQLYCALLKQGGRQIVPEPIPEED